MKDLSEHIEAFKKELANVKEKPWSIAVAFVLITGAEWAVFQFTYSNRIESKDATIQARESERDGYKSRNEILEKENEKLRQNWTVADPSLSLRAEALNLAKQLEAAAEKWTPEQLLGSNEEMYDRFSRWIEDVMRRLDRHGQWSQDLKFMTERFTTWNKTDVAKAATELRRMAENLKD